MVDDPVPAISRRNAVRYQTLVQGKVPKPPALGRPVAGSCRGPVRIVLIHRPSDALVKPGTRPTATGDTASLMIAVLCLVVQSAASSLGWLAGSCWRPVPLGGGGPGDRWRGGGPRSVPTLDMGRKRVTVVKVVLGGGVGQRHGGDGGVAVHVLAGQPGHFPAVPVRVSAGRCCGLRSLAIAVSVIITVMVRLPGRVQGRAGVRVQGLCRRGGRPRG